MSVYIQNFVKFKPFLKELVSRDVKVKYRRSILGGFMDTAESTSYDDGFIHRFLKSV